MIDNVQEIRKSLAAGMTLPAAWYSDDSDAAPRAGGDLQAHLAVRGPHRSGGRPGDWFTCVAGTIPIVVTRDQTGTVNAFVNVCRHRGHLVASGSGNRASLQCSYHAWTYDLDGTLRKAPRSEREPDFDPGAFSLLPAKVDAWGPLLFVNPDVDAPGARRGARALYPKHVEAAGVDLDRFASGKGSIGRSPPTGRSRSRTISSATTAPSRIRVSAR